MTESTKRDETLIIVVLLIIYPWPKDKTQNPERLAFYEEEEELTGLEVFIIPRSSRRSPSSVA